MLFKDKVWGGGWGGDPSLKSSLFRRVYSYQVVRSDVKYKTCSILSQITQIGQHSSMDYSDRTTQFHRLLRQDNIVPQITQIG